MPPHRKPHSHADRHPAAATDHPAQPHHDHAAHHARHAAPPHGPAPLPASQALQFVDPAQVERILSAWVPDAADRGFVMRCLLDEGPIHHRGANFVLIALLWRLVSQQGLADAVAPPGDAALQRVPMRLPPHLAESASEAVFPLALHTNALRDLAGGEGPLLDAMLDCLTDGPPQHALGNVVMVNLLDRLLTAQALRARS